MADQNNSNIGYLLAVSTSRPATEDEAGYGALTYTDIACVTSIGERGEQAQTPTLTCLSDGIEQHVLGTRNFGQFAVTVLPRNSDAGQDIIRAHVRGSDRAQDITFRETDSVGNLRYYQALVTNYRLSEATAETIETATFQISANTQDVIVES